MPFGTAPSKSSALTPNAGTTSARPRSKSSCVTFTARTAAAALRFFTSTCRRSAHAAAAFTTASISAPEKFFMRAASAPRSTLASSESDSRIWRVWMASICCRPCSSGSEISTCTSRRPGRSSAGSMSSLRFVMPITSMLLSESTPSILASSWFTAVSCTPVESAFEPRWRHMASISSSMMMCRSLSSPFSFCSASASANSSRIFASVPPTYLSNTSGPLTIFGSRPLSILPIWRAMSVLPVPGGPYSSMPRTCVMPSCLITAGG
mmetsp:Transcript_48609/g.118960  ORF Transcript_48609/g.118960 Transcript_48609/m.118960 type:complete len:265 (+) Transcript_48609:48-842(+)